VKRLALVLLALAGCNRADPRCAPAAPSTLALRDGAGVLRLALKNGAICDARHHAIGSIDIGADAVTLKDPAGNPRLTVTRSQPENTAAATDAKGAIRVRLYRDDVQARVLRPDGVPIGSMVRNGDGARIYDPASVPIMTAEPRDRDLVLRDANGVARSYVVPGKDARAAGVFAMGSLDPAEQLAIYVFWSR
jgi:hypothetical protein